MAPYISVRTSKTQPSIFAVIPILCSLLVLQMNFLSSYGTKVWNMTDTKHYPACLGKAECEKYDARKQNPMNTHACFQYFCYPWQEVALTADEATKPQLKRLFKGCRNSKDCPSVKGKKGHCFRHHDKRNINRGICMRSKERRCEGHNDCASYGGRCCNGFCCNEIYFNEIKKMPCTTPEGCQDVLAGDQCCFDITGSLGGFSHSRGNWEKRCCTNERGPAIVPTKDISEKDVKKINDQISRMSHGGLDETICKAFEYDQMIRYSACNSYTTTTLPTTTTTTTTTLVPRKAKQTPVKAKGVNAARSISDATTKVALAFISLSLIMLSF